MLTLPMISTNVLHGLAHHFIAVLCLGLLATKLRELVLWRKMGRKTSICPMKVYYHVLDNMNSVLYDIICSF
jgi:hypothetical protein